MLHQNKWDVIRSHLCHIISTKLEIPNFLLLVISLLSNYTMYVHMIFVCRMLHLPVLNDCHYLDNGWNARNIRRKGDTTTRILKVASAWQGLIIKFPLSSHSLLWICLLPPSSSFLPLHWLRTHWRGVVWHQAFAFQQLWCVSNSSMETTLTSST